MIGDRGYGKDGNSQGQALCLPLPLGEGRGEGSQTTRPSPAALSLTLSRGERGRRQGTYPSASIIRERGERRQWRRRGSPCGWLTMLTLMGLVMVCCIPLALAATTSDLEAQVREIAAQLRCPVCQGLSVGDSPSELANEMRTLIREQLQQGKTSAEVLDYFAQRYGEWILLAPPKRGFNLVIWVLPFVLLPIGAAVVYVGARRWVRRSTTADPSSPGVDTPYARRLQRELDSYQ
jgi:cytochrome c-type biogenesis protein CcmH/NrfF